MFRVNNYNLLKPSFTSLPNTVLYFNFFKLLIPRVNLGLQVGLAQDVGVGQDDIVLLQEHTHNVMPIRFKCFGRTARFVLKKGVNSYLIIG